MRLGRRMMSELDRDIEEHLAMETEENIARGMSPEEARYAALRKFGSIALVKEDTRAVWSLAWLDTLCGDFRHACRRMRRAPGTAAVAMLSLALAFAPSVTVFSVLDRLFLTPVPARAPQEIYEIEFRDTRADADFRYQQVSYPEFREFHRALQSFSGMVFHRGQGVVVVANGRRTLSMAYLVSNDYFDVLGMPVRYGPGLSANRAGLVVSNGFWKRELGGRSDVIGRTLLVDGGAFTIDGVAPSDFHGVGEVIPIDLCISLDGWLRVHPEFRAEIEARDQRRGNVLARLRSGVPPSRAESEVASVARQMSIDHPETNRSLAGYTYAVLENRERGGRNISAIAVLILGVLLAVACANVAGILLAEAEERRHETAVRQALGASRARLVREWMVEAVVLSVSAAVIGLAAARAMIQLLPGMLPALPFPLDFELTIGPRVWMYALALVGISVLSFGLVPAWRGSRPDLLSGLRRDLAVSVLRVRIPVRTILIVAQVAAAEILLFAAGLLFDTLSATRNIDPGIDPRRPVALAMAAPTAADGSLHPLDCDAVRERLARIGGVRRVTYGRTVPLSGSGAGLTFKLEAPQLEKRDIRGGYAGPGFLPALGIRILSGRDLQAADRNAALANVSLARALDPAGRAVGRSVRLDGNVTEIVGVFQDAGWSSVRDEARPRAIRLMNGRSAGEAYFAVEVNENPEAYLTALRNEIPAAQPGAMVLTAKTIRQLYEDSLFAERLATKGFYALGLLALLFTAGGLHGIASALFARRSREFAIRLALGASPRQIMGVVLRGGLTPTAVGLAIGVAVAIPAAVVVASQAPGFSPWSASALGLSSAIVLVAAAAAALRPARRSLRIQPAAILRTD